MSEPNNVTERRGGAGRRKKAWLPDIPDEHDADQVLDKEIQQEILGDFEHANASLVRLWQGVFSVISYGISFIYVYGGYSAVANEYTSSSIRFFGSFSSASSLCTMHFLAASPLFILGLVFTREMRKSSAFFAGAAEGAPPPRRQPFLENRIFQTSLVLALLSAGVWMELIVRAGVLRSDPVLLYLPLGPILYCMIALYVDHSLREIARDVEDFRKMVYEAKTL